MFHEYEMFQYVPMYEYEMFQIIFVCLLTLSGKYTGTDSLNIAMFW